VFGLFLRLELASDSSRRGSLSNGLHRLRARVHFFTRYSPLSESIPSVAPCSSSSHLLQSFTTPGHQGRRSREHPAERSSLATHRKYLDAGDFGGHVYHFLVEDNEVLRQEVGHAPWHPSPPSGTFGPACSSSSGCARRAPPQRGLACGDAYQSATPCLTFLCARRAIETCSGHPDVGRCVPLLSHCAREVRRSVAGR
jgi:hypothetical protein